LIGLVGSREQRVKSAYIRAMLVSAVLAATPAIAVMPPITDVQLQQSAELVVTGRVIGIDMKKDTSYPDHVGFRLWYRNRLVRAIYTVTISADRIDKGVLDQGAKQVVFTAWSPIEVPEGFMIENITMRPNLRVGDRVKVFLAQNEPGAWSIFHEQGLKVLPPE
jgi:hypothetical protein